MSEKKIFLTVLEGEIILNKIIDELGICTPDGFIGGNEHLEFLAEKLQEAEEIEA